jgi:hypothetical protein
MSATKVIKRKLDITPYNRAERMKSNNSPNTSQDELPKESNSEKKSTRKMVKNYSQENISNRICTIKSNL